MKTEEFNQVVQEQIDICQNTLVKKADEYATEDRLHNFVVAAELQDISLPQALAGMMAKHTVSVYDLCRDFDEDEYIDVSLWTEKITDHINYLLLLKAVVVNEGDCQQFDAPLLPMDIPIEGGGSPTFKIVDEELDERGEDLLDILMLRFPNLYVQEEAKSINVVNSVNLYNFLENMTAATKKLRESNDKLDESLEEKRFAGKASKEPDLIDDYLKEYNEVVEAMESAAKLLSELHESSTSVLPPKDLNGYRGTLPEGALWDSISNIIAVSEKIYSMTEERQGWF